MSGECPACLDGPGSFEDFWPPARRGDAGLAMRQAEEPQRRRRSKRPKESGRDRRAWHSLEGRVSERRGAGAGARRKRTT